MKLIFANRYFYPDQSATSRVVSSLAFALAEENYAVTVLTGRHRKDGEGGIFPASEEINGVSVRRIWTSNIPGHSTIARAADYATFHLSAAAWLMRHTQRGDICVICTDPPLLSVTSALPISLRGGRMVNWIMDLFPETAVELGVLNAGTMPGRLSLALRDWSLRKGALTICPIDAMARYLATRGLPPDRAAVVHHWSDGEEIRPIDPSRNRFRDAWGLGNAFVVGYSGNFGRAHEFKTLLNAAHLLRDDVTVKFLFVGDGHQRGFVEAEARSAGLSNVIFKPFQPSQRLAESLSAADLHIVSLKPELEHCIVPSKFYGVLAAGRPTMFIGDLNGEIASVVRASDCGEAVEVGDSHRLAERILSLKVSPVRREVMGTNARQLLEAKYSREYGVEAWRDSITPLLSNRNSRKNYAYQVGDFQ